jgi:hypothetical protein
MSPAVLNKIMYVNVVSVLEYASIVSVVGTRFYGLHLREIPLETCQLLPRKRKAGPLLQSLGSYALHSQLQSKKFHHDNISLVPMLPADHFNACINIIMQH